MQTRNGFTIVELVIVIVVIAILASLAIINYRGTDDQATNVQIISGVKQYYSAIVSYKALNGKFPATADEVANQKITLTCLGTGYKNKECGIVSGKIIKEDAYFNNLMIGVIGNTPPAIGANLLPVGVETFIGAVYGGDITGCDKSSTCYARTFQYALKGKDQDCVLPNAYAYRTTGDSTACEVILEEMRDPEAN